MTRLCQTCLSQSVLSEISAEMKGQKGERRQNIKEYMISLKGRVKFKFLLIAS